MALWVNWSPLCCWLSCKIGFANSTVRGFRSTLEGLVLWVVIIRGVDLDVDDFGGRPLLRAVPVLLGGGVCIPDPPNLLFSVVVSRTVLVGVLVGTAPVDNRFRFVGEATIPPEASDGVGSDSTGVSDDKEFNPSLEAESLFLPEGCLASGSRVMEAFRELKSSGRVLCHFN